jgi:hypothetical protein
VEFRGEGQIAIWQRRSRKKLRRQHCSHQKEQHAAVC